MVDMDLRLSLWFSLRELCRTDHRDLDNVPTQEVVGRLQRLVNNCLMPLRSAFGPIWVNSGYRSPAVNKAVGGSEDSAHLYGCAADIVAMVPVDKMMTWLEASDVPFDQAIAEHSSTGEWLHIGMVKPDRTTPRREMLHKPYGGQFEPWTARMV